jgi:hypothetical protein
LGTNYADAVASVGGDLFFLTKLGVRSLVIAAGATNLATGDVGSAIDALIQAKLAGPDAPHATYYPGNGQFWLIFANEVFVYSRTKASKLGAWSRYLYPFSIDETLQLNGELYFRAGNIFYRVDESAVADGDVEFEGIVWSPYLDMGSPGTTKMLDSFDIVAYGECEVSIGYDQATTTAYTTPFVVGPDTVPGGRVPLPLAAPSMAVKLRFMPGQQWQLNAMNLYIDDFGGFM